MTDDIIKHQVKKLHGSGASYCRGKGIDKANYTPIRNKLIRDYNDLAGRLSEFGITLSYEVDANCQ